MKLIADAANHLVLPVQLIAAGHGNILPVVAAQPAERFSTDPAAPFWTLPVLMDDLREEIHGAYAAAECLAAKYGGALLPADPFAAARSDEWVQWYHAELAPLLVALGKAPAKIDAVVAALKPLDKVLAAPGQTYIADPEQLHLVDLFLWAALFPLLDAKAASAKAVAKACPALARFYAAIPADYKPFERALKGSKLEPAAALAAMVARADAAAKAASTAPAARAVAPAAGGKKVKDAAASSSGASAAAPKKAKPSPKVTALAPACPDIKLGSTPPKKAPLPQPKSKNVLITSALPYVNNVPHLGNIIGCVLSADVYARYCRLAGYNTVYVCGTDEYGTATETAALRENLTPKQICDKYHAIHAAIYKWFDIGFDTFGRTSTPKQTEIAQDIFEHVSDNGRLVEQETEQTYCSGCERFLADRFVEGTCPTCKYDDARGDQCDGCGKLLNPVDLLNPRCVVCSKFKKTGNGDISVRKSNHLFLNLPEIAPELQQFVEKSSVKGGWSSNSTTVTKTWLRDGLKLRCITRDLSWGTPVPRPGYEKKVFYVWFDAPIGYISICANHVPEWKQWWQNPDNVELVQFMGKDNIPFHTVIFPSSLIASGQPWTMLHHISTTEYLQYENGKFSKSRGTGVFGDNAMDTGIPSEVWRYYLLATRPESSDSIFSWADVQARNNSELLANLGNFCNRAMLFTTNNFDNTVPAAADIQSKDKDLIVAVGELLDTYRSSMDAVKLRDSLRLCLEVSRLGNQYWQDATPWVEVKSDKTRCGTIVALCLNLVRVLAVITEPFMPAFTQKVFAQLNIADQKLPSSLGLELPAGHKLGTVLPIFRKLEDDEIEGFRTKFGGVTQVDFPLDLKVGKIVDVQDHPKADKLYVIKVSLGEKEGERQCVSGIKAFYAPDALKDKRVIVVTNMKPAKLRDVESQGVILVADNKKEQMLLTTSKPIAPGTQVLPADAKLAAKKGLQYPDILKIPLSTGKGAAALFDKSRALAAGSVAVVADKDAGEGLQIK